MLSSNLDKKVIEAAENHHPAYNENAWNNMEKLLDEHLPVGKKKRRRFLFLLFFSLLIGVAGIVVLSPKSGLSKITTTQSKEQIKSAVHANELTNEQSIKIDNALTQSKENTKTLIQDIVSVNKEIIYNNIITDKKNIESKIVPKNSSELVGSTLINNDKSKKFNRLDADRIINLDSKNEIVKSNLFSDSISSNDEMLLNASFDKKENLEQNASVTAEQNKQITNNSVESESLLGSEKSDSVISKNSTEIKQEIPLVKRKTKKHKDDFLFLSFSAGPDFSFVSSEKIGDTKLLAGLGVGYKFKNRLSIRSGFYFGRKVYTASGDNYNPPIGFVQYYPILENVEADCKVYEIPLSFAYNFSNNKKYNWFAGIGFSSYIMKKEVYNYTYKYIAAGPSYKRERTINNENKHLFSVATFSSGVERQLGKSFTFTVEPYFKLPLSGVGYGKVKLNSAGVLFTISLKPFESFKKPSK